MSLPKARTHKQYQEFVKKELTLRGIGVPFILQDVFFKLYYLDLSPVRCILKECYFYQGAPVRGPEDMLYPVLTRSSCKRSFKREKEDYKLAATRTRGKKIWTIRYALACMCQHIDAWSKMLSPSIPEEELVGTG